jgi:hypothetical protein
MSFEVVANSAATGPIPLPGLGFSLAASDVHVVESEEELEAFDSAKDAIATLADDNAYPAGSPTTNTLTIRRLPGSVVVAPADVANFLDIRADADGHSSLKTLAHDLARTNSPVVSRDVNEDIEEVITYTDDTDTVMLRKETVTRDGNGDMLTAVAIQYDGSAAENELETITSTVVRDGNGDVLRVDEVRT